MVVYSVIYGLRRKEEQQLQSTPLLLCWVQLSVPFVELGKYYFPIYKHTLIYYILGLQNDRHGDGWYGSWFVLNVEFELINFFGSSGQQLLPMLSSNFQEYSSYKNVRLNSHASFIYLTRTLISLRTVPT